MYLRGCDPKKLAQYTIWFYYLITVIIALGFQVFEISTH